MIECGVGYTARSPGPRNPGHFIGDSTVILGNDTFSVGPTTARWQIAIDPNLTKRCDAGYLIICCERTHGGLHSKRAGAIAHVFVNGHNRDLIDLRDIPNGHTDYFHRPATLPQLPSIWPTRGCATIYAWPVDQRHLKSSQSQDVVVELEQDVAWDVDYVCIVTSQTSRQLRDGWKQLAYVVIGVVLGAIASLIIGV